MEGVTTKPTTAAIVICGQPDPADLRLVKLLGFLGIEYRLVDLVAQSPTKLDQELNSGCSNLCLMVSAKAIRRALDSNRADISWFRNRFLNSHIALIYCASHDYLSASDLQFFTDGVAKRVVAVPSKEDEFKISDNHRWICGPFSGLTVTPGAKGRRHRSAVESMPSDCDTFVSVDGKAVFMSCNLGKSELFLVCSEDVADLDLPLSSNFDANEFFPELVPYLMFLKYTFADVCWQPNIRYAGLIIDDPPIRSKWGFLQYENLVHVMDKVGFSSNIAFIPWNFRRSNPSTETLFKQRSDKLALCLHGCDHTKSEFGTNDSAWLTALTRQSLERMDTHQRESGIDHERIMVFPQGVFSGQAMQVLKGFNFLAAVNTEIVPQHNTTSLESVPLSELFVIMHLTNYGEKHHNI